MEIYFWILTTFVNLCFAQIPLFSNNFGNLNIDQQQNRSRFGIGIEGSLNGAGLHFDGNRNFPLPQAAVNLRVPTIPLPTAQLQIPKITPENVFKEEWNEFKLAYDKVYHSVEEEKIRFDIFLTNRQQIARSNQDYNRGHKQFVLQMNSFGDLVQNEFNRLLNGFRYRGQHTRPTSYIQSANAVVPKSVDWRKVGAVTAVKKQNCSDCYAFAAAGALEGHRFRATGLLEDLSPQNLVDCSHTHGNNKCNTGDTISSFEYVRDNDGLDAEAYYPYEGHDNECRFRPDGVRVKCTGFTEIPELDEKQLEYAVATEGPVAAAIDASASELQFYSNGIFSSSECKSDIDHLNHAVLIVGYDVNPNGEEYWIIKNSYGPNWGIGGYLHLAKGKNMCGIATYCSYPLVQRDQ